MTASATDLNHKLAEVVGLMTWMMKAAPHAVEIVTALYVGVFNSGIALGSWAGGQVVDGFGLAGNLWLSGGLAAVALLLTVGVGLNEKKARDGNPAQQVD